MPEPILLLNPRKRRRRKSRRKGREPAGLRRYRLSKHRTNPAKKITRRRRRRGSSYRRRTGRRRHSIGIRAGHYRAINRRRNRRRNRRHGYTYRARHRRNPTNIMGRARGLLGQASGVLVPAGIGAVGGILLDTGWGYLTSTSWGAKIPQAGLTGLGAKFALVVLAGWAAKKFGGATVARYAGPAMLGAGTVLLYGAGRSMLHSKYPNWPGLAGYMSYQNPRLHGYMPRGGMLGDLSDVYSPAAVIQPPGVAVPRQFGALRGYVAVQPHMGGMSGGLAGWDYMSDGM